MLAGMRKALEVAAQEPLQKVLRKPFSVPAGDSDEEIMEFVERASQIGLPPDLDLRDRLGRRPAAARLRLRGPARRRRLGDADDHARQHERRDDHDRREGRGSDPRSDDDRPRRDVRRPPPLRPDDALRESRLDGDLAARRPAGRPPLRARPARGLGRRHGHRLGDRPRRAGARDPAHDRRARQRGRRARHRARQPRAARRARRPAGPPPPRAGAVPGRPAARPRGRVPGVGRPAGARRRTCPARSPAPTTRRSPAAGRRS